MRRRPLENKTVMQRIFIGAPNIGDPYKKMLNKNSQNNHQSKQDIYIAKDYSMGLSLNDQK